MKFPNRLLLVTVLLSGQGFAQTDQLTPTSSAEQDTIFVDDELVLLEELSAAETPSDIDRLSGVSRAQAKSLYDTHLAAEQFDEAVDAARYGLELLESELGANDVELAPALNDLGSALLRTGEPQEALLHFERSADLLRNQKGLFTKDLFAPLLGQGYAQQMVGEHGLAVDSFRRGQHVIHRNDGVLGLDQVPAIEAMADSLMALGESKDAERMRLLPLKLYRTKFGRGDVRTTAGLYSLAGWYFKRGDFRQALVLYDRGLRLEQQNGADQVKLLPGLMGQVAVYSKRHSNTALEQALVLQRQVIEIIGQQPASRVQLESHLLMGDLLARTDDWSGAEAEYRTASEIANQLGGNVELFSQPKLVYTGPPISSFQAPRDELPYYDFKSTIDASGRPIAVEVVGTNVRGRTRSIAIQHFKEARFRPRMENDEFVETDEFVVRRTYLRASAQPGVRFNF